MKALQMEKQLSCWVETGVLLEWKILIRIWIMVLPDGERENRSNYTGRLDLEY